MSSAFGNYLMYNQATTGNLYGTRSSSGEPLTANDYKVVNTLTNKKSSFHEDWGIFIFIIVFMILVIIGLVIYLVFFSFFNNNSSTT